MQSLNLKSSAAGALIFWIILLIGPSGYATAATNWEDIIFSPPPQMDLKQVIQVSLPDLESQVQQAFRDNIDKIKQIRDKIKDQTGITAGMAYEITLVDAGGNKIAIECDMLDLAGWDQKSNIPFKFKIEKKDVGTIEVTYDPKAPIGIKEIKLERKMPGGVVSQSGTIAVEGTWEKPEIKINYGQKAETPDSPLKVKGEAEQTIGLDLSRSADDLYDPEWNPRSEWMIVRGIEEIIAMTTWGVKFSGKHEKDTGPGEKIITGVDVTVDTDRVRNWWTDWLFSDMNEAFDRLNSQLDNQAEWRRNKIEAEAVRLGINPGGKTNQQLINEIHAIWKKNPELQRPVFKNPGPKIDPADLQTGPGVRTGSNTVPNQPGVPLNTNPSVPGSQGNGNAGWENQYKDLTNPYKDLTNPYKDLTNPYKHLGNPYK